MALPPGRRGAFGDWLKAQRERRYETQRDALAAYRKLAGLAISGSEYAQWESGSRTPKPTNPKRLALYAFYGSREEEPIQVAPEPVGLSDLIEALGNQTAAISLLVSALRPGYRSDEEELEALNAQIAALQARAEALADRLQAGDGAPQQQPPQRQRTAG